MKIFIINLARTPDRKQAMQQKIAQLPDTECPPEFIFFSATDASAGQHQKFSHYFNDLAAKIYMARPLSISEKGCYASHFSLWQHCIQLNEPIVVLEDDIIFTDHFLQGLATITHSAYEYVRFMATFPDRRPLVHLQGNFYLSWYSVAGALGYYITPQAAKKFSSARYWSMPVDDYMDTSYLHGVKNILHLPPLVAQSDEASTLAQERDSVQKALFWKVIREVNRLYIQGRRQLYRFTHSNN